MKKREWIATKEGSDSYGANIKVRPLDHSIIICVGEDSVSTKYHTQIIGPDTAIKMATFLITWAMENQGKLPSDYEVCVRRRALK